MLKTWLNKWRQRQMTNTEDAFAIFADYLEAIANDLNQQEYDMHYELLEVSAFLISTEFAGSTIQFNQQARRYFNLAKVERDIDCQGTLDNERCSITLSYNDKTLSWQETPTQLSAEFEIFRLAQLLAGDVDIRLEVASMAKDDRCFFVLTPALWQQLESQYGQVLVQNKFRPLGHQFYRSDYQFEEC